MDRTLPVSFLLDRLLVGAEMIFLNQEQDQDQGEGTRPLMAEKITHIYVYWNWDIHGGIGRIGYTRKIEEKVDWDMMIYDD